MNETVTSYEVDLYSHVGTLSRNAADHFQTRLSQFKTLPYRTVFAKSIYLLPLSSSLSLYISQKLDKNMKQTSSIILNVFIFYVK